MVIFNSGSGGCSSSVVCSLMVLSAVGSTLACMNWSAMMLSAVGVPPPAPPLHAHAVVHRTTDFFELRYVHLRKGQQQYKNAIRSVAMSAKVAIQAGAPPPAHLGHSTGGSSSGGSGGGPSSTSLRGFRRGSLGFRRLGGPDSTASGPSPSGVSTLTFSSSATTTLPYRSVIVHDHFDTPIAGTTRWRIVVIEWPRIRKPSDLHIASL